MTKLWECFRQPEHSHGGREIWGLCCNYSCVTATFLARSNCFFDQSMENESRCGCVVSEFPLRHPVSLTATITILTATRLWSLQRSICTKTDGFYLISPITRIYMYWLTVLVGFISFDPPTSHSRHANPSPKPTLAFHPLIHLSLQHRIDPLLPHFLLLLQRDLVHGVVLVDLPGHGCFCGGRHAP